MKSINLNSIERVLINAGSAKEVQQQCRNILIAQFEENDFPNSNSYKLVLELCNIIGFPIDYAVKTEKIKTRNDSSITVPLVLGCIGLSSLFMPKIIDSIVALSAGAGIGYYFSKSKTIVTERSYLVINTSSRELMDYMTIIGQTLLTFAQSDSLVKDNYSLLSWLRDLYVKCKEEGNKGNIVKEIEMIFIKNGYKLVDYSEEVASCFESSETSNPNLSEPKTTCPAIMNSRSKNFVAYGKVVFPK